MIKSDYFKSWSGYWKKLQALLLDSGIDEATLEASVREARKRITLPVLWLLGKTGAGKTSIIRALTADESVQVGNGFQPCTSHSQFYDFPAEAPILRFLDTRGLGEADYDPTEDLRFCAAQAHLLLAVMKTADPNQQILLDTLRTVRQQHPNWPVLMVQTGLHELYPATLQQHPMPWPYATQPWSDAVPADVQRALRAQRTAMSAIPGSAPVAWAVVDFTLPEDGFAPVDYGLMELWQAIEALLPHSLQQQLKDNSGLRDLYANTAHQHIVGYAMTAAGLGALPLVDLAAVTAVQAKLLHKLATLYGQRWDARSVTEFVSLAGTGLAVGYLSGMAKRTLSKMIPLVGQTAGALWNASASGATTYALGKAAVYFLNQHQHGLQVDPEVLRRIYTESLAVGRAILDERLRKRSS